MKYYIILLSKGSVIDVMSFDEEDCRDKNFDYYKERYNSDRYFDDVQKINIVN